MSCLSIVDVAVLGTVTTVAAIDHVAARQLATCCVDVTEWSPAVEIDVVGRRAVHIDVQVAWLVDLHIIESRVRGRVKAVGGSLTVGADKAGTIVWWRR